MALHLKDQVQLLNLDQLICLVKQSKLSFQLLQQLHQIDEAFAQSYLYVVVMAECFQHV